MLSLFSLLISVCLHAVCKASNWAFMFPSRMLSLTIVIKKMKNMSIGGLVRSKIHSRELIFKQNDVWTWCCSYLLLMISQMVVLQVLGVGIGEGWTGGSQWLLLVCHSCAILGHEGSILPLGSMQSSFRLLSHVPREIVIISKKNNMILFSCSITRIRKKPF